MAATQKLAPGIAFTRLVMAQIAEEREGDAEHFARKRWGEDALATKIARAGGSEIMRTQKSNVIAGATASGNWAELLVMVDGAAAEFFSLVRERSLLGRIPGLRLVPLLTRLLQTTTGFNAAWVGEGQPVPVSTAAYDESSLTPYKCAALTVVTMELLKSADPAAETFIRDDLVAAVTAALDATFIDPANAGSAGVKPISVTYNAPSVTATGDGLADFRLLLDAFPGDLQRAVVVGSPKTFAAMNDPIVLPNIGVRGGDLLGVPAIPSTAAGDTLALIDPDGIAYGNGTVETRVSTEASIEMLTNPTNNVTTPTATNMVSLWETNSAAIMAEAFTSWEVARPSVAILETVAQS